MGVPGHPGTPPESLCDSLWVRREGSWGSIPALGAEGVGVCLGHFQVGRYRFLEPYRNNMEALYTLNSPPVVSFKFRGL